MPSRSLSIPPCSLASWSPVSVVHAAQEELVYLLRASGDVHQRVARDTDDVYCVVHRVEASYHNRVGVVGHLSKPTTRKVYMPSTRLAGAPALGSSVGSGVALASGSALSTGVVVLGCTSPPCCRSGGFSKVRTLLRQAPARPLWLRTRRLSRGPWSVFSLLMACVRAGPGAGRDEPLRRLHL